MIENNMEVLICNKPECTLAQTGSCILSNEPLTCRERLASIETGIPDLNDALENEVITPPQTNFSFSSSYTMTPIEVQKLMGSRYCKIVGILGVPSAGKTACLVSLYLLLAHNRLSGYKFRDSKTIMAFEEISRGAKRWNDLSYPEQLTLHTEISDERTAGFLHLRIEKEAGGEVFDLLLPDLPGEWSTSLIDTNRVDRLSFLSGSDVIWLFVNGLEVDNINKRKVTIHRLKVLIERVASFFDEIKPNIYLIVTHKDDCNVPEERFADLIDAASKLGFEIFVRYIASFSSTENTSPGDGVSVLIDDLVKSKNSKNLNFWSNVSRIKPTRQMLKFGQE